MFSSSRAVKIRGRETPHWACMGMGTHPHRTGSSHGAGEKSSLLTSVAPSTKELLNAIDHFPPVLRNPMLEQADLEVARHHRGNTTCHLLPSNYSICNLHAITGTDPCRAHGLGAPGQDEGSVLSPLCERGPRAIVRAIRLSNTVTVSTMQVSVIFWIAR